MMINTDDFFSPEQIREIKSSGRDINTILSHVRLFFQGSSYARIIRPATLGDGIMNIPEDISEILKNAGEVVSQGLVTKFVPASGEASRMFKILNSILCKSFENLSAEEENFFIKFKENLSRFAFYNDLEETLLTAGHELKYLIRENNFKIILEYLLTDKGLDYSSLPKACIKFHSYENGSCTPLHEHLMESIQCTKDRDARARIHFTVKQDFLNKIKNMVNEASKEYKKTFGVSIQADYSFQEKTTDTIAVTMDNKPFMDKGKILFRPGGHGTLINNLNLVNNRFILIKNIDNISHDHLKSITVRYEKILIGLASEFLKEKNTLLTQMEADKNDSNAMYRAREFIMSKLNLPLPGELNQGNEFETLYEFLNRPLRVCGVVKNTGEPGGGPFWVNGSGNSLPLQIVEEEQIHPDKRYILTEDSTHFNPT
ncbi:MAG: DUF4301 family protein, partial [bacterium]